MKKKVLIGIIIVVVAWISMLTIDCVLPTIFDKKPIFCFSGNMEKDGGSGTYQGLGYSIKIKGFFIEKQEIYSTELNLFNIFKFELE